MAGGRGVGVTPFELRAHTAFSFGDGAVTPEALAARAAELGYPALGLTDTADFGGIPRFVLEAERRGVKPVIGAEPVDGRPMAFLVESEEGYRNLKQYVMFIYIFIRSAYTKYLLLYIEIKSNWKK